MKIRISDYFGKPEYYPVMPPEIFESLEKGFKEGDEYVDVDDELFDEMIVKYNKRNER